MGILGCGLVAAFTILGLELLRRRWPLFARELEDFRKELWK